MTIGIKYINLGATKEINMVRDFKGRLYNVLDQSPVSWLLECVDDGTRVRIRAHSWDDIGFVRP